MVKYNLQSIYKAALIPEITVNRELCTGCGACIRVCPKGVFTITDGKSEVVNPKECITCSACYARCPAKAIVHSS
jgi:2-oxoglutarate ferredoxin oxidoreductase subunit delta